MSSIFKNVIRSRRKKNKTRSTTPVNFNETLLSKPSDADRSSSIYHDQSATKKNEPQQHKIQFLRVSTDGNIEKGQSLNDAHPNRSRSMSFESQDDRNIINNNDNNNINNTNNNNTNSKPSHSRKNFLKSLRRKLKHGSESQNDPLTPDTLDSGGANALPMPSTDHKLIGALQESFPAECRTFDEFPRHDKRKSKDGAEHGSRPGSNTEVSTDLIQKPVSKRIYRVASSSDDKTPPVQLEFYHNGNGNDHQMALATKVIEVENGKRSSGNTKTVIMNRDIALSSSYTSKSSCDTATITSASSNSKARAMRRKTERNARAASTMDEKANELFERGYFDKAMACYTMALKLKRRTFAHLLEDTEDLEGELELRDDRGNPADPHALVSMATSINNIGYLRQRSGDATPEETMGAYKKSLRIKRRILGNDSLSVGKTLNNIGSVHYLKRELDKALSAYLEALEIMKANLGDTHPDVATVMSNIGDVYLAQGDKETSIKYYRLALAIRWEAFGEKSPRVVRLLEKISNLEIGDMTRKMVNQRGLTGDDVTGDDVASELMVGSDFQPVSEALRQLQEQVKSDIDQLDQMERDAAIETFKDKIIIIRGMRDVWNGSDLLDNDSASVQTALSRLSSRY